MSRRKKILAVASAGGHWTQLMRLRPAFEGCDVSYISTLDQSDEASGSKFYFVPDGNRFNKIALVRMAVALTVVLLRERPDVVISTGAAPGYMAIRLGKLIGSRTIWLDSFANVNELSLSGRLAKRYADLWLTQWPHLASADGPDFVGTVI